MDTIQIVFGAIEGQYLNLVRKLPPIEKPEDMLAAAQALIIHQPQEFPGFWHPDWQARLKDMPPTQMLEMAAALIAMAIDKTPSE